MKNDIAVSNPNWRNDGNGVLSDKAGNKIRRIGKIWRSLAKHVKAETERAVPMLSPEILPHLYIQE